MFCREQRASGWLCFAMSNDFLCTVVFCGLLACCKQGPEFLVEILYGRH
jgi:hypothetical protein